jgi:hypothetical protein
MLKAFRCLKKANLIEVVIELDLNTDLVRAYYLDYLDLTNRKKLTDIHLELKNDFPLLLHLFQRIKKEGLNKQDVNDLLKSQNKLKEMENRIIAANRLLASLNSEKLYLEKEITEKENLLLGKTGSLFQ